MPGLIECPLSGVTRKLQSRPRAVGHCRQLQGALTISAAFLEQPLIEKIDRELALGGAGRKSPERTGPSMLSTLGVPTPVDAGDSDA